MSLRSIREALSGLEAELSAMEASEAEANRKPARAVSLKAKNLKPGDVIEWPYEAGRREAGMVTTWPDRIDVITNNAPAAFFGPEERVRVYRG